MMEVLIGYPGCKAISSLRQRVTTLSLVIFYFPVGTKRANLCTYVGIENKIYSRSAESHMYYSLTPLFLLTKFHVFTRTQCVVHSSTVFMPPCDVWPMILLTHYRLGGGRGGSSTWPGHSEGQRQQCQPQWLPRGPGELQRPAFSPGASQSGERTQANTFLHHFTTFVNVAEKMQLQQSSSSFSIHGLELCVLLRPLLYQGMPECFIYTTN